MNAEITVLRCHMQRCFGVAICLVMSSATAWADRVYLSNDRTLEGIVVEESETGLKVQVAHDGYVSLSKDSVVRFKRASDEERRNLLARWHQEFLDAQQRQRETEEFEASQRERGLVQYQGQWITAQELALIQQRHEEEIQRQREGEAKRSAEMLKALQEENKRLTELISQQQEENRRLRELVSEQQLLLAHTPRIVYLPNIPYSGHPRFFQDEYGNWIHTQEHQGRWLFTMPDGTRADLQWQNGRLMFVDSHGVSHYLDPIR